MNDTQPRDFDSLNLAQAAEWYAGRGIPVFPCRPRSKEPLTAHGFKDATTDVEQVRRWWRQHTAANIGMPTGAVSGMDVLDIDPRNGGEDTYEQWIGQYGRPPDTLQALTGGDGKHVYYRHVDGMRTGPIAAGVDWKSDGGYVILPPSVHPSGRPYSWDCPEPWPPFNMVVAPPGWLIRLVREKRRANGHAHGGGNGHPGSKIPVGRRNVELTSIAGVLRARGAGEAELRDLLLHINHVLCETPLEEDEVTRIARSVSRYEPSQPNLRPDEHRIFERIEEGHYRMQVPQIAAELEVDYLRREDDSWIGELSVRCFLPGARGVDGLITLADFNLSSMRARLERAKLVASRVGGKSGEIDWIGIVEDFSQRVIAAEREGEPARDLREWPEREQSSVYEIDGLVLPRAHPTIMFGDGGSAKSYTSLYLVGRLAQQGVRVAYLDWELDGDEHKERLRRLFGPDWPRVVYARCDKPLTVELERLRRIVRDNSIEYCVLDSVALACDGPPEAAETAQRYFQALRRLGIGTLNIAHVTKADDGGHRPFGSIFWHNGARSSWYVRASEPTPGANSVTVGFYHRKANTGELQRPVCFRITFDQAATIYRRIELTEAPDLVAPLSIKQRMVLALRRGPMEPETLAEAVDAKSDTVARTARRYRELFTTLKDGRLALLERSTG